MLRITVPVGVRVLAHAVPLAETAPGQVVTVAGVVRSVRRRPWAGHADVVFVIADGTGLVTVELHDVGPMDVTAGVDVIVTGRLGAVRDRLILVDPVVRANS